tara:strand:- start:1862 stop:3766 length:1905 start_codon:yes stop_codon:yes gene_type:complete
MSYNPIFQTPSKSLADRLYSAEFDDAVIEQPFWKNPRYEGCKIISKEINKFTPPQTASDAETGIGFATIMQHGPSVGSMIIGGTGNYPFTIGGFYSSVPSNLQPQANLPGNFKVGNFIPNITWQGDTINPGGLTPNIKKETTALYISNTVIGSDEDPQFTTIKNHSYVNINQILLIDPITDETQILDKQAEDFAPFHSFITNDLPTGTSFSLKLIDESISHNLKGPNQYKVKMNKGFLLKTFDFKMDFGSEQLTENNSMYLYKGGIQIDEKVTEGLTATDGVQLDNTYLNNDRIRFRYGTIEVVLQNSVYFGHQFAKDRIGPSFGSASIIENKFTQQYYSGSYGFINEPQQPQGTLNTDILKTSGLGSASRFIGLNTLDYLYYNNLNNSISQQEKTELHLTLFEGTKDFSSGSNDERSISTFEVDSNQNQLDIGGLCNDFLPKTHELLLKGVNDSRFEPKTPTYEDTFINAYLTSSIALGGTCVAQGTNLPGGSPNLNLQLGINADETNDAQVFVQGGFILPEGFAGYQSESSPNWGLSNLTDPAGTLFGSISSSQNFYSGSFGYQLSFLDKDHTLITNCDKAAELFDGIGTKGVVVIPENTHPKIKNNIQYYLQQAGIIPTSPNTQVQLAEEQ